LIGPVPVALIVLFGLLTFGFVRVCSVPMSKWSLEGDYVCIRLNGWASVFALRRRVEVDLGAIRSITVTENRPRVPWLRIKGTGAGFVTAGLFGRKGQHEFWLTTCRRRPVVLIDCTRGDLARLVLDVAEPEALCREVVRAQEAAGGASGPEQSPP